MTSQQLWALFEIDLPRHGLRSDLSRASPVRGRRQAGHRARDDGRPERAASCAASGSGPIAATVNALALPIRIDNYEERALRSGADASALGHRRGSSRRAFRASVTASAVAANHRYGVGSPRC